MVKTPFLNAAPTLPVSTAAMPSSIQGICVAQPFNELNSKLLMASKILFHLIEAIQGLALSLFSGFSATPEETQQ
jgi:hypothetical protein